VTLDTEKYSFLQNRDPRYIILSNREKREQLKFDIAYFIGAVSLMKPDVLIYLDKSARPISWVVNAVLKAKSPDKARPETKYFNFGRERTMLSGRAQLLAEAQARAHFAKRNSGTYLDGKKIWLVDELASTGETLAAAKELLTQAIGDGLTEPIETTSVLRAEPVWYRHNWMTTVYDQGGLLPQFSSRSYGTGTHQLRGEMKHLADDIAEMV